MTEPTIAIQRIEPCGDAWRYDYTATRNGHSLPCGLITTLPKDSDDVARVLVRQATLHLRDKGL